MTDKKSKNNSPNNKNKFFDVSFDEPIPDDNQSDQNKIRKENDKLSPRKWDNFYEKFQKQQSDRYSDAISDFEDSDYVSQSQSNKPSKSIDKSVPTSESNLMINRSIQRVQNLFDESSKDKQDSNYYQIRSAKGKHLSDRAKLNSFHSTYKKEPIADDRKLDTASSDRRKAFDDLPTPEQLALERERRRKLRIERLEKMSSWDEVEQSYEPRNRLALNSSDEEIENIKLDTKDDEPKTDSVIDEQEKLEKIDDLKNTDKLEDHNKINESPVDQNSVDKEWVDQLTTIHLFMPQHDTDLVNGYPNKDQIEEEVDESSQHNLAVEIHNDDSSSNLDVSELNSSRSSDDQPSFNPLIKLKEFIKGPRNEELSLKTLSTKEKTLFGINVTFNVIKKLLIYIIIIVILLGVLVTGTGVGFFANLVANTPPPTEQQMREQINQLEQQSALYYGSGELIADVRTDIVRSIANLDDISQYVTDGLIATEDEYFEEHQGIVPKAIFRAVVETLINGAGTGGSTLTQQLVKQQMLSNDVTFFRKANEMLLAVRLENYFSKEEILTAYLNVSPFGRNNKGDNIAGITAAAEGIFGVSPDEVSLAQAAFLVGLPQDPYTYTPYELNGELRDTESLQYGMERMKEVLFRMYRAEKITKEEYDVAINYDITQDFLATETRPVERQTYLYQAIMNGAIEKLMLLNIQDDGYTWQQVFNDDDWYNDYYFAAEEQLRTGGYNVYSTIDKEIYEQLNASAQAYEDQLGVVYDGVYTDPDTGHETYYIERVQTGLVAIDNNTGRVLGFVAGTDYENNQIDHAFNMRRSPGSTIKPLAVYGPAVDNNLVNPATIIPDTSFVRSYDDGTVWEPTNYGTVVSDTFMTARTALYRSDNIPAVRIYEELIKHGVPIIDYLEKMGFNTVDSYTKEDTLLLPFALGGVSTGPTVFEQTRGFSTFANNGQYVDGYYIDRIEDAFGNTVFQQSKSPQKVFSEDSNYLMVDMLRDTFTDGTGRTANDYLNVPGDWIAKSGISENSKDVWFIGSTPSITIGSWIGYDSRYAEYTIDVNDGFDRESVRSQIYWAKIVNDLYALRPEIFGTDKVFSQPSSVQEQTILEQTGTLPGSFTYNGANYQLTGPTKTELFKLSNPAPTLTFDFMLGASEEELSRFWNNVRSQQAEQTRQQQQQQNQPSNNSGNDEESSDSSESQSSGEDESTGEDSSESSEVGSTDSSES